MKRRVNVMTKIAVEKTLVTAALEEEMTRTVLAAMHV